MASPSVALFAQDADSIATPFPDSLKRGESTRPLTTVLDSLSGRQILDRVLDLSLDFSENNELLEQFNLFRLKRININEVSVLELSGIPFVLPDEAQRIIQYRSRYGRFESLDPLVDIFGADKYSLLKEIFVITQSDFGDPDLPMFLNHLRAGSLFEQSRFELVTRVINEVPNRFGFDPSSRRIITTDSLGNRDTAFTRAFLGSPSKVYNRLQVAISENFFISGLAEKDIGESSLVDFHSLTFQLKDVYNLRSLIIGDYNLRFGQGLAVATGRPFFKSAEAVVSAKQSAKPLRPYTSVAEYGFFRGAAAQVNVGNVSVIGFYSDNDFTASQNDTAFTSFDLDGFYRTETERARRGNINERVIGAHLDFDTQSFSGYSHLGATFFRTNYSVPLSPAPDLRNAPVFRGDEASVASVDWDFLFGNVNLFGESAYSLEQGKTSVTAGILTQFAPKTRGIIIVRYFDQGYFSPFANAFQERGSDGRNERGIYFGLETALTSELKLRGYADYYHIPFITFTSILPAKGIDLLLQASYRPSRTFLIETLIQRKTNEEALTQSDVSGVEFRAAVPRVQERIRTDFVYQMTPQLRLRTRLEAKHVTRELLQSTDHFLGWFIAQDVGLDLFNRALSLDMRVAFFQTDNFDAAIYAFENDLPLLATIFAHNGRGRRVFLNGRYRVTKGIELAFRFANTFRDDVTFLGSGNDRFLTNSPSTVSLGLRANF